MSDASRLSVTNAHDRIDQVERLVAEWNDHLSAAASVAYVRHLEERIKSLEDARQATVTAPPDVPPAETVTVAPAAPSASEPTT